MAASPPSAAGTPGAVRIHDAQDAIDAAHEYAASIADGAITRDRLREVPLKELAALDASGLLEITVPRRNGGPGLGATVLTEVIRVIAAVDPSIAQVLQPHFLFTDVIAI